MTNQNKLPVYWLTSSVLTSNCISMPSPVTEFEEICEECEKVGKVLASSSSTPFQDKSQCKNNFWKVLTN